MDVISYGFCEDGKSDVLAVRIHLVGNKRQHRRCVYLYRSDLFESRSLYLISTVDMVRKLPPVTGTHLVLVAKCFFMATSGKFFIQEFYVKTYSFLCHVYPTIYEYITSLM